MNRKYVMFSPVTRLSGLLSVETIMESNQVAEANVKGTLFRGFEWIMKGRHIRDAVYMTQRICGICSMAHGACASYLLDELYDNEISENGQLLRNIMYASDFLQNHIRHYYLFSMPDFVRMPERAPFEGQDVSDLRLNPRDNDTLVDHYFEAIKAAQESHQILTLFGGKAPHQHSFVEGGVAVIPTADKIGQALALINNIRAFVRDRMVPDTELIARVYRDYFSIGVTPARLLSFGLFRFGPKNEVFVWRGGVLNDGWLSSVDISKIHETVTRSWFREEGYQFEEDDGGSYCEGKPETPVAGLDIGLTQLIPDPNKPGGYSWVKSVQYSGEPFEVGPLARMTINGFYRGGMSTMDRIYARTVETLLIADLVKEWLCRLRTGPAPISQKEEPEKNKATALTDAMRGSLLHSVDMEDEKVISYNIITPTTWNFSPKDDRGQMGPVENALVGTRVSSRQNILTVLGRIIRSFDPCLSCGTHVLSREDGLLSSIGQVIL